MLSALNLLNNTFIADGKLVGLVKKIENTGCGKVTITTEDNQVISAENIMVVSKDLYEPVKQDDGTYKFKSK